MQAAVSAAARPPPRDRRGRDERPGPRGPGGLRSNKAYALFIRVVRAAVRFSYRCSYSMYWSSCGLEMQDVICQRCTQLEDGDGCI